MVLDQVKTTKTVTNKVVKTVKTVESKKDKVLFDTSINSDLPDAIACTKQFVPDDVLEDSDECERGCKCGCISQLQKRDNRSVQKAKVNIDSLAGYYLDEVNSDLSSNLGSKRLLSTLDPAELLSLKQEEKQDYRTSRKAEKSATKFPEYVERNTTAPHFLALNRHSIELESKQVPIGAGRIGKKR